MIARSAAGALRRGFFLVLFLFSLFTQPAFASEQVSVRAEVNRAAVTIGQRLQCTVFVRHDPKVRLVSSLEFPNTRDFEVKAVKDIPPKQEKGVIITGRSFEVAAYGLGEFVIDEIPLRYRAPDVKEKEIKTNRIYITVESVDKGKKPKSDIRGIKPPVELRSELWTWVGSGLALLLTAGAGIFGFLVLRKKKLPLPGSVALLPPHDEAYQALRALHDSPLIREGKVKEYYFRLSEIIRVYLDRRFEFSAVEKTTDEIAKDLRSLDMDDASKQLVREFLEQTDLVKFAKHLPGPREIVEINKRSLEIVNRTKPVEPAVPTP